MEPIWSNKMAMLPGRKYKKKRYGDHPPRNRRWTTRETHIMRMVVFSCNRDRDLVQACMFLCKLLDREPNFGPNARPTTENYATSCYDLIKDRLSNMLVAYRDYTPDDIYEGAGRDHLIPLPWVDRRLLLLFKDSKMPKPSLDHVAKVLGRTTLKPIEDFLSARKPFSVECHTGKRFRVSPTLEKDVTKFLKQAEDAPVSFEEWNTLYKRMEGRLD
jgi:hypothetical protein